MAVVWCVARRIHTRHCVSNARRTARYWLFGLQPSQKENLFFNLFQKQEGRVNMCRKLTILCLMLVVLALSVHASAVQGPPPKDYNGDNESGDPIRTQSGCEGWDFRPDCPPGWYTNHTWSEHARLDMLAVNYTGQNTGSRNRYQAGGAYFGNLYQDFFYVGKTGGTASGLGVDYIELLCTFSGFNPYEEQEMEFTIWSWDPAFGFNEDIGYGGAGEPANSKRAVWSQTNPAEWLTANGYPAGYAVNEMPAELGATLLGRTSMMGPAPWIIEDAYRYATTFSLDVTADAMGTASVTLYGWNDMTTWAGDQHMPINGLRVIFVPEPATVALLGLGGLALWRKRSK
jgi:hypothetical protein